MATIAIDKFRFSVKLTLVPSTITRLLRQIYFLGSYNLQYIQIV